MSNILTQSGAILKRHFPTILACVGAAGVVATAVLSAKAATKADELIKSDSKKNHDGDPYAYTKTEAVKSAWKCYIPTITVGTIAIVCIFGSNVLNRRQQAALASAYTLVSAAYTDYRNKVKELYGEETHQKIMESIASEKAEKVYISAPSFANDSYLDFGDADGETRLFYDSFSNRYFESTIPRVLQAEYRLNRNFMFAGSSSLNNFYEFLGLETTDFGSTVGWSTFDDDIYWIDFNHSKIELEDGLECCVIDMAFEPTAEYREYI